MIYKTNDPYLNSAMDRHITGSYGEDEYDGYFDDEYEDNDEDEYDDEYPQKCERCGERFLKGDEFYELRSTWNREALCRSCAEEWLDEPKEIK